MRTPVKPCPYPFAPKRIGHESALPEAHPAYSNDYGRVLSNPMEFGAIGLERRGCTWQNGDGHCIPILAVARGLAWPTDWRAICCNA